MVLKYIMSSRTLLCVSGAWRAKRGEEIQKEKEFDQLIADALDAADYIDMDSTDTEEMVEAWHEAQEHTMGF